MIAKSLFLLICAASSSSYADISEEFADLGCLRAMHAYRVYSYNESGGNLWTRQMCPVPCGGRKCCNMGEVCIPGGCSGCLPGEVRCVPGVQGCCPEGTCSLVAGQCDLPCAPGSSRCGDSCCNNGFACDHSTGTAICVVSSNLPLPAQTSSSGPSAPAPSLTPEPSTTTSSESTAPQTSDDPPSTATSLNAVPSVQSTTTTESISITTNTAIPIATTASQALATVTDNLPSFSSANTLDPSSSFTLNAATITALTIILTGIGRYLI